MIRKIILFFIGFALLCLMFVAVALSSAIYDAGNKITVDTFLFQPMNLSSQRVDSPEDVVQMGDARICDVLIKKYVNEYFYVRPSMGNISMRMQPNSVLAYMSSPSVFEQWKSGEAQNIQKLAEKNAFRTVSVIGEILKPVDSDYYTVDYELRTWYQSNDMGRPPEITRGRMFIALKYASGIRESFNLNKIHKTLDQGISPVILFKFRVTEVK